MAELRVYDKAGVKHFVQVDEFKFAELLDRRLARMGRCEILNGVLLDCLYDASDKKWPKGICKMEVYDVAWFSQ